MRFPYFRIFQIFQIILFLFIASASLFNPPVSIFDVTIIGFMIIGTITYIFEIRHYQNKVLNFTMLSIIVALVLIITNYQISSPFYSGDIIFDYITVGIFVLGTGFLIYWLLGEMKIYQKTILKYDNSLKINPEDTTALNNKATALISLKKYQEAMKCFEKAMKIDPLDAIVWHNKGVNLEKLGKHQEALKYYDKALELDPKFEVSKKSGKIILES